MKNTFRAAVLGLSIVGATAPANAQILSETYYINRIYQQLKDLSQSGEFRQFRRIVNRTQARHEPRVQEMFNGMRTIESGYHDGNNGPKLALSFCVTNDISTVLHLGGQAHNILRYKMNNLHRAARSIAESNGGRANVNNCPEIYSRYNVY